MLRAYMVDSSSRFRDEVVEERAGATLFLTSHAIVNRCRISKEQQINHDGSTRGKHSTSPIKSELMGLAED
jgi:hypothetical protein